MWITSLARSAKDNLTGKTVAIKKISKAFNNLNDTKRTLREIKLLRHFKHENVAIQFKFLFEDSFFTRYHPAYLERLWRCLYGHRAHGDWFATNHCIGSIVNRRSLPILPLAITQRSKGDSLCTRSPSRFGIRIVRNLNNRNRVTCCSMETAHSKFVCFALTWDLRFRFGTSWS